MNDDGVARANQLYGELLPESAFAAGKEPEFSGTGLALANQIYGALTAEFYLAGFTFERAMRRVLWLLETGEWKTVGGGFDDVNDFVRSLKLGKFKVITDARAEFVKRVKELQPEVSNRAIADAIDVSKDTIDRDASGRNRPLEAAAPDRHQAQFVGEPNTIDREATIPSPLGAADGERDARLIHQRDTRVERREEKVASMGKAAELSGRFSVIYADPPWTDDFGPNSRQIELHYPVMTNEEIINHKVKDIAADDAILFLWALPHMIPVALQVMSAWGFEYRTTAVWAKDKVGLGQWMRNKHEQLLIGRRGAFPPPPEDKRVGSVIEAPVGEHSAKPEIFPELIEDWYREPPKIELFRRGPIRPGWSAWGFEAGKKAGG